MLMSGSWHIYRHGERWQQPRVNMRIVIENSDYIAVGFRVPVAEMHTAQSLARDRRIPRPEIDVLSPDVRCRRSRAPRAGARQRRDRRCAAAPGSAGRRGQRLQVGDLFRHRHQPVLQSLRAQLGASCMP